MNVSKYLSERSKFVKPTYQTSINLEGYINIGSGTPNFFPPQQILNAYKNSIDDYKLTYTSWSGLDDLKVAASNKLKRENDYNADPYSEILITSGAQSAILASLMAILNINDEVTIWGGDYLESRLENISNKHNLLPYVYLTNLSKRVQRVYV